MCDMPELGTDGYLKFYVMKIIFMLFLLIELDLWQAILIGLARM